MEENSEELKKDVSTEELNKDTGTSKGKTTNTRLIGIIAVLAVALIVVILVFFIFIQRSAKATVKDVAKAVKNVDVPKLVDLVDPMGIVSFMSCYDYRKGEFDFEDFEENYKKLEENYNKIKKEIKKGKYTIDITNTKKVSDCKKLTKVTCNVTVKYNDSEVKLKGIVVYTMQKGLKNYIVGVDPESIENLDSQLDKQEDALYDMLKGLGSSIDLDELEDVISY